jgi:uncharacterized protein DUF6894
MNKYFFDVTGQHYCEYDHQGRILAHPEEALSVAELLALDLEVQDAEEWLGCAIVVRDCWGKQLCSVPVRGLGLI